MTIQPRGTTGFPVEKLRHCVIFGLALSLAILVHPAGVSAQPAAGERGDPRGNQIHLLRGNVDPTPPDPARLTAAAAKSGKDARVHVLIQLSHIPGQAERDRLAGLDVELHDYIPQRAWIAALPAESLAGLARIPFVEYVKIWEPEDKVHPRLAAGEIGPWAVDEETGLVKIFLYLHKDVPLERGADFVRSVNGLAVLEWESAHSWSAWVPEESVAELAQRAEVYWIEEYPPPLTPTNDGARENMGVNTVAAPPFNLTGDGINVFVFDAGRARPTHEQLSGKITTVDSASNNSHATHVAATVAGKGTGTTQPRAMGMAPDAWILTAGFSPGSGMLFYDSYGDMITDYNAARNNVPGRPANLSNNSIGANVAMNGYDCDTHGMYGSSSRMIDRIVRGDESGITGAYKRYIVAWAAGNERTACQTNMSGRCVTATGRCGGGFNTLGPPASAKNPIHVGALFSDGDAMSDFSSWGPTASGRIKPTVTGPGCEIFGDGGIYSATASSDTSYAAYCGTSMAAPAVAGVVALILQDYRALYSTTDDPLNAAIKALLIHTAKDLGPPGPDFMYGYGRVDAPAAVTLLRRAAAGEPDAYFHDVLRHTPSSVSQGDSHEFQVVVPAGSAELKVSLAWDDPASAAPSTGMLANDLDLEVVAPDGTTIHYPWVLDPAQPWLTATRGVNTRDPKEQVVVEHPAAGNWTIRVKGTSVPQGPQSFALVYSVTADPGDHVSSLIDYAPTVADGGFELNDGSWDLAWGGTGGAVRVSDQSRSGNWSLRLGGATNRDDRAAQVHTIPADATAANLSYWFRMETNYNEAGYDWMAVYVIPTDDSQQLIVDMYHNGTMKTGNNVFEAPRWAEVANIDLLPWAGKEVRLLFRGVTDGTGVTTFWIDDVRLEVAVPGDCEDPAAPTNLQATTPADNRIDLSWTGVTCDSYRVYRATTAGGPYTEIATGVPGTTYSDTTVTAGETYYYVVTAFNEPNCESGYSNEASATATGCVNPDPPANLQATAIDLNRIDLTWDVVACDSYRVYRSTDSGGPYTQIAADLPTPGYSDTTVAAGETYYYVVTALNDPTCESGYSNEATATTPACTDPDPPTNLQATTPADNRVDLTWTGVTCDNYRVSRATSAGGPYTEIATGVPGATYSDTTVTAGQTYYYVVTAFNEPNCESGYSNEAFATATGCVNPDPPANLQATAVDLNRIDLTWNAGACDSYRVYRATTSGGPYTEIAAGLLSPGYSDTTVAAGQTYYYVVTAFNEPSCESGYSGQASATTPACTDPGPPANLQASVPVDYRIDLTWTGVTCDSYRVYRATSTGGPYTEIANGVPGTTFSDTTVSAFETYYYVVTAFNEPSCESATSNEASATATGFCTSPPAFAGLVSVAPLSANRCGFRLEWEAGAATCPDGAPLVYNIYRSASSGFTPGPANLLATCGTATFYEDVSVATETAYFYIVRAEDATKAGTGACTYGNEDTNTVERSSILETGTETAHQDAASDPLQTPGNSSATVDLLPAFTASSAVSATLEFHVGHAGGTGGTLSYDYPGVPASVPANSTSNFTISVAENETVTSVSTTVTMQAPSRSNLNLLVELTHVNSSTSVTLYSGLATGWSSGTFGPYAAFDGLSSQSNWRLTVTPTGGTGQPIAGTLNAWNLSIDYAGSGDPVTCTQVELIDPLATATVVKAYGVAVAAPYDVTALYTGPGTYQLRLSEDCGDQASLTGAVMEVDEPACLIGDAQRIQSFTVRSGNTDNLLEWVNPAGGACANVVIRFRTDGHYPTGPEDGSLVASRSCSLGAYDSFTHSSLTNNTTYYYGAFVDNGAGVYSAATITRGRPFDTSGQVKWAYHTGATAVAPPGIRPGAVGSGAIYSFSNDRGLHGMTPTAAGGQWPRTSPYQWRPITMNAPAQNRPSVIPTTVVPGTSRVLFAGSQDGHVYAVNAETGGLMWTSADLGAIIQAAPTGMFTRFGGAWDILFVPTRAGSADNRVIALSPATGAQFWEFNNGGGVNGIGIISSSATVDYAGNRIFFTSRARVGGSADTVWALSFTDAGATKLWSRALGGIDAAPVLYGDRLYVGTNTGDIYALNADTGATIWQHSTGAGAVKGFVWPEFADLPNRRLVFSTTSTVWALTDQGASVSVLWSVGEIPSPSAAMLVVGQSSVIVGSSDGRLYRISLADGSPTSVQLGPGTAAVGAPGRDTTNDIVHVGTEDGVAYAVVMSQPEGAPAAHAAAAPAAAFQPPGSWEGAAPWTDGAADHPLAQPVSHVRRLP